MAAVYLQSRQLPIGGEDIELAVILAERGAFIGRGGVGGFGRVFVFAHGERSDGGEQAVAVGGEIFQDLHGSAGVHKDGDHVSRGHLRANEFLPRGEGAQLIGNGHRAGVEIKGQQALISIVDIAGLLGGDLGVKELGPGGDGLGVVHQRRLGRLFELLMLHESDRLWCAVFGDDEIFGG